MTCSVPGCRFAVVHDLVLPLCAEHRDLMVLALVPETFKRYPPDRWLEAGTEYAAQFGTPKPYRVPDRQPPPPRPANHPPVVYFIGAGDRVKIGTTVNLNRRITSLSLPGDARVLMRIPGDAKLERHFHSKFRQHRIGDSEWFHLRGDLADFIAENTLAA